MTACVCTLLLLAAMLSGLAGCDSQPAAHAQPVPHVTAWMNQMLSNQRRLRGRSHWQARGGALQTLGKQKLERIRERSALSNFDTVMLARKLDTDSDLFVDEAGEHLLQTCSGLSTAPAGALTASQQHGYAALSSAAPAAAAAAAGASSTPRVTRAQVFSLSSRPGALKKIVLDFDGHNTTNSKWNTASQPVITSPPWDTDGDPTSFSERELGQLKAIWSIVAEDFAAFDVDVTTKDPGDAALLGIGVRVIIGGDSPGGVALGGVAWIGSFGTNNPAFVYPYRFYSSVKFTGEAASHEAGHTLGLLHDDNVPDGNIWGPIMASSRQLNLTTFDKGEYFGASNKQDDYAVMSQSLDLLPQQHGRSIATATPLPAVRTSSPALLQAAGVISNQGQVDLFSFAAAAGATLDITAAGAGSITTVDGEVFNIGNLDVQLSLYGPNGAVLQTANPSGSTTAGLSAHMRVTMPSNGTYYVSIAGIGAGNPAGYGYSNYGSRGQYRLTVQGSTNPPTPVASPSPGMPSPPVSPNPAASPSPPLQQPSPSPSPDPSPSPSPLPVGPATMALLSSFPADFAPKTANLAADGPGSSCSIDPCPVLGEDGTSLLSPGHGQCSTDISGTYKLVHSASALPLLRWECYNITSGVVQEPVVPPLTQVPGSSSVASITLHANDVFTCVAVFAKPPSPSPAPPAVLALLTLLPLEYTGPGPDLTASSAAGDQQCVKAPAPALPPAAYNSSSNATAGTTGVMPEQEPNPGPDVSTSPSQSPLFADASPSPGVENVSPSPSPDTWSSLSPSPSPSPSPPPTPVDNATSISITAPGPGLCNSTADGTVPSGIWILSQTAPAGLTFGCWECYNLSSSTTPAQRRRSSSSIQVSGDITATLLPLAPTNDSSIGSALLELHPTTTVTCVAVYSMAAPPLPLPSPSPSPSPVILPSPSPSPLPWVRPARMTISMKSSTAYTNTNATSAIAWFTIEARDINTNQPVSNVRINAAVRLSHDNAITDPRGRFPYNVSVVTGADGRQSLRTAAVRLAKVGRKGSGVQVILQIMRVRHPVYLLGNKPMLRVSTNVL